MCNTAMFNEWECAANGRPRAEAEKHHAGHAHQMSDPQGQKKYRESVLK